MHYRIANISCLYRFGLLTATLVIMASPVFGEGLYAIDGGNGVVTFTTTAPAAGSKYRTIGYKTVRFSKIYSYPRIGGVWKPKARPSEYDSLITDIANDHGVDPILARAVVHVESAFNRFAFSPKGAMGLMQLMPGTARRYGVGDPWSPDQNVQGGIKYLKWLLDRYKGDVRLALAAYNAGEQAVDKYSGIPPYSETVEYVKRVTLALNMYRCLNDGKKNC